MKGHRSQPDEPLRALFCLGVSQTLCDTEAASLPALFEQVGAAFADLDSRFGVRIIGSFDDDQIMVGPSATWPYTAYILAEVPSYETVVDVCNIIRETHVGPHRLWRYLKIEARVGRRLFFVQA